MTTATTTCFHTVNSPAPSTSIVNNTTTPEQRDAFAKKLGSLADVYVNDDFSSCVLADATSVVHLTCDADGEAVVPGTGAQRLRLAGPSVQRELNTLRLFLEREGTPCLAFVSGPVDHQHIGLVDSFLDYCKRGGHVGGGLVLGGALGRAAYACAVPTCVDFHRPRPSTAEREAALAAAAEEQRTSRLEQACQRWSVPGRRQVRALGERAR